MNLAAMLDGHPDDATALVHHQRRYSYGELRDVVARSRAAIVDLGLEPDDRVALVAGTTPHFIVSYLALLGAGMVVVPLNPLSPGPELARELAAVQPRALVAGPMGAAAVATLSPDERSSVEILVVPEESDVPGGVSLDDSSALATPVVDRSFEDLAVLMFTSGTAGAPKAAMLSHGCLLANLQQMEQTNRALHSTDVVLCPIPLFHIHGLNALVAPALRAGASLVLMERFDASASFDAIREEGVTVLSGPPALWASLVATPADGNPLEGVRMGLSGAAPLPPETRVAVEERFDLRISEGYGLTESGSVLTVGDEATPAGSVGRPLPGVRLRLVDPEGDDVYVGDAGEVLAKGPNIFAGYWNDTDASSRVLDGDGWLHTGDLAVVGDDGLLRLVDRAKDLIVVSGFNVYPAEVEEIVRLHPAVADVGVVGVPHPHHGEAVRAYVVVDSDQTLEVDDVIAHCQRHLAGYKCPGVVSVVDVIPRTVTGKVRRRDLRSV